jgi:hypothetical protein
MKMMRCGFVRETHGVVAAGGDRVVVGGVRRWRWGLLGG